MPSDCSFPNYVENVLLSEAQIIFKIWASIVNENNASSSHGFAAAAKMRHSFLFLVDSGHPGQRLPSIACWGRGFPGAFACQWRRPVYHGCGLPTRGSVHPQRSDLGDGERGCQGPPSAQRHWVSGGPAAEAERRPRAIGSRDAGCVWSEQSRACAPTQPPPALPDDVFLVRRARGSKRKRKPRRPAPLSRTVRCSPEDAAQPPPAPAPALQPNCPLPKVLRDPGLSISSSATETARRQQRACDCPSCPLGWAPRALTQRETKSWSPGRHGASPSPAQTLAAGFPVACSPGARSQGSLQGR